MKSNFFIDYVVDDFIYGLSAAAGAAAITTTANVREKCDAAALAAGVVAAVGVYAVLTFAKSKFLD